MDKDLHDDIGDIFRDNIEPLSQPPREEVWRIIERQLDKKDILQYQKKNLNARRLAALLISLLLCFGTCTYIYFTKQIHNNNENSNGKEDYKNDANKNTHLNNITVQPHNIVDSPNSNLAIKKQDNKKPFTEGSAKDGNPDHDKHENVKLDGLIKKYSNSANNFSLSLFESNKLNNNSVTDVGKHITSDNDTDIQKENSFTDASGNMNSLQPVTPADALSLITTPADDTSEIVKIQRQFISSSLVNDFVWNFTYSKNASKIAMNNPALFRLSVTVFAAPEKVGYHLQNDPINPYDNKQLIKNRERQDLSFSTGILLGYDITNRLTLQSGISFSSANTNIAPSVIYAEKNNAGNINYRYNTSFGYGYILPSFTTVIDVGDSINATRADQTIQYINIPLLAKYKFGTKRLGFSAGAGISLNFLNKATLYTGIINAQNQENESITQLAGLKNFSCNFLVIPEVRYSLSKRFSLSLMPYFKYALLPVNKGNVVKTYPYNLGAGIGTVYKF